MRNLENFNFYKFLNILKRTFILTTLTVISNACDKEEFKIIETNQKFSYQESLIYARILNDDLSAFLRSIDLSNRKINESALTQEFIKNQANKSISSYLAKFGEYENIVYQENYSNSDFNINDLNGIDLSGIEKTYLNGLYEAAYSQDSGSILEILEAFKADTNENPELENLYLIFALIETNQAILLENKDVSAKNCSKAAETGGIIGGVFGMIRGAIAGGVTGTVLGLNPGTGGAGAVVGAVGGGVVGFAEGAILGYIGCRIFR